MSEVKSTLKEINVQASIGGKVQIVKFEYSEDFHFSMSQRYEVEGIENEAQASEFRAEKIRDLQEHLEEVAQRQVDKLVAQRDGE